MKKLLFKLAAISLLATPINAIVSCSSVPSSNTTSGGVTFSRTDYAVLMGKTLTVEIANFSKLSQKGYGQNIAVQSSDNSIATYSKNADDTSNSSISIEGVKTGSTTITISYTNMSTQEIVSGSFKIHVLDFSNTTVDWYGTEKEDPIDIYSAGEYVVFGKINGFDKFKSSDYGYDYTTGFNVSLKSDDESLYDYVSNVGMIDSDGQICFKYKDPEEAGSSWEKNDEATSIKVNVSNSNLGINIQSDGEYVASYTGGAKVTSTTEILNFANTKPSTSGTDVDFISNGDGTYKLTYTLHKDTDKSEIDPNTFSDASNVTITEEGVQLLSQGLVGVNEFQITLQFDRTAPHSSFQIDIALVFNLKDIDDANEDDTKKYAGTIKQGFADYIIPTEGVDGQKVSDTKAANDIAQLDINQTSYTPLVSTTVLTNQGNQLLKNYSYSSWLVLDSDDSLLEKLNPDPSNPNQEGRIKQTDIDDATKRDLSKTKQLAFNVNDVTVTDNIVEIDGTGAVRHSDVTSMVFVLVFKDSANNIAVGQISAKCEAVRHTVYSSYIDTTEISPNKIVDKENLDELLDIHDGSSRANALERFARDRVVHLQIGNIDASDKINDYSNWKVNISNISNESIFIKKSDYPITKDGYVTLTEVGLGVSNVGEGVATVTISNPNDATDSVSATFHASAFIGGNGFPGGIIDLINHVSLGSSVTISNSLTNVSFTSRHFFSGTVEFNNDVPTLQYSANRALLKFADLRKGVDTSFSNYIVFDTPIDAIAPDIVQTSDQEGYSKKLIFNGDVKLTAQASYSTDDSIGCGVVSFGAGKFVKGSGFGTTFNGDIDVETSKGDSGSYTGVLGVMLARKTTVLGDTYVEGSVKVDSTNWGDMNNATGFYVSVNSQSSSSVNVTNDDFDLKINGDLEIDGYQAKTKAVVNDYYGQFESSNSTYDNINLNTVHMGKSENSDNGYGNAVLSKSVDISYEQFTNGYANITIYKYYDANIGTYYNMQNAPVLKFRGGCLFWSADLSKITIGGTGTTISALLGGNDYDLKNGSPLVVKTIYDLQYDK